MPYRVTKTIDFSYGHRLLNYNGPCRHLHGHNGRLEIILGSTKLDPRGMVVDFADIKMKIKRWVDDHWDHRMILNKKDPWLPELKKLDSTIVTVDDNPTAEHLSRLLFEVVRKLGFPVVEVRLWETPASWASYRLTST
ncbi:MAG: 6-carboxytetrahydropterin synthase [Elusimicrobia bacterium]|nr:6-carboxytetrahydropterin synthase [Elusimicrobiota bacterium]